MKEKYMMDKSEHPTTYISDSDAIMDMEDAYNKSTPLYLEENEGPVEHLLNDIKGEYSDKVAKKYFERRIVEKFYDHQVNNKQELNKCALDTMTFSNNPK